MWVPCDFEHDTLREKLLDSGFDPARPSLIVWLGVTAYLTRDALDATLADLASLCAPGSRLVFDYLDTNVVAGDSTSLRARLWTHAAARFGSRTSPGSPRPTRTLCWPRMASPARRT